MSVHGDILGAMESLTLCCSNERIILVSAYRSAEIKTQLAMHTVGHLDLCNKGSNLFDPP